MPIRPENKHRYPADWPAIRERILKRAGWQCEHPECGARQYDVGWWKPCMGRFQWCEKVRGMPTYSDAREVAAGIFFAQGECDQKPIVIVLTVAHLDHQPENCDPSNLLALCQRHHLAYDAKHHQHTAYATRKAAAMTADLFDGDQTA